MKKLFLLCIFALISKIGFGQTYTDSALKTMTKMQLTVIYLKQVETLALNSPYTPFTIGVSDTIHGDLDIPVSKQTIKTRDKIFEVSKKYNNLLKEKLYELVPYSDKKDIIRAILFLQETNSEIKK